MRAATDRLGLYTESDGKLTVLRPVKWRSGTTDVPLDSPVHKIRHVSSAYSTTVYIVFGIVILLAVSQQIVVFARRKHPIMKSASPTFLHAMLLGIIIGCTAIPFYTIGCAGHDYGCSVFPAMLGLGFSLIFGPLIAKTWSALPQTYTRKHSCAHTRTHAHTHRRTDSITRTAFTHYVSRPFVCVGSCLCVCSSLCVCGKRSLSLLPWFLVS